MNSRNRRTNCVVTVAADVIDWMADGDRIKIAFNLHALLLCRSRIGDDDYCAA